MVADTDFDFDLCFVGPENDDSLVILLEVTAERFDLVSRKIRGLSRSLKRSRSNRTLTTIIVGLKVIPKDLAELEKHCRAINILPSDDVTKSISELLRLNIPTTDSLVIDPGATLIEKLDGDELAFFTLMKNLMEERNIDAGEAAIKLFEKELHDVLGVGWK